MVNIIEICIIKQTGYFQWIIIIQFLCNIPENLKKFLAIYVSQKLWNIDNFIRMCNQ